MYIIITLSVNIIGIIAYVLSSPSSLGSSGSQ